MSSGTRVSSGSSHLVFIYSQFFFLLHAERFSTITRYYQAKDLAIVNVCSVVSKRYGIYLALKWAIIFKAANRINFDLLLVD